ncbi:MAG: MaoC family dehydratase [Bacillota bacterium]|nr:MAG: MaoC family dehydratase [Bacillota bacterium]
MVTGSGTSDTGTTPAAGRLPAVGEKASLSKAVTEADVVLFAEVTGDTNPVHLDEEAAARSVFGRRVAHGMLTAGLISAVLGTRLPGPGTIYLGQELRFTRPVFIGDTVTATVEVIEVTPEKRRVRLRTTCVNDRGETVVEGEARVMVEGKRKE